MKHAEPRAGLRSTDTHSPGREGKRMNVDAVGILCWDEGSMWDFDPADLYFLTVKGNKVIS